MPASPAGPSFSAAQKCLMLSDRIARAGVITQLQCFHFYREKEASFPCMSYNFHELTLLVKVFAVLLVCSCPGHNGHMATVLLCHT